jgi:hypothetical protein
MSIRRGEWQNEDVIELIRALEGDVEGLMVRSQDKGL